MWLITFTRENQVKVFKLMDYNFAESRSIGAKLLIWSLINIESASIGKMFGKEQLTMMEGWKGTTIYTMAILQL